MPFHPNVNDILTIGKATYCFTEHPSAKGMPYGQSGRRGTVYQIRANEGDVLLALKVFTQSFRVPRVAEGANALRSYAKLPGLQVCARLALTSSQFPQLIRQYSDLEYAVMMPWVEGKTWQEILLEKESFSRAQSLQVAKAFAHILVEMENRGVAHCDLSGPNVMIKGVETSVPQVALVDVEDLFAENLKRPEKLSGGSSGYSHKDASKGLWQASADRFAGSILLAEMLGWCDEDIRRNSYDEQYFPPSETQVSCERYEQLYGTLQTQWGNPIADLFARAWFSETLNDCPTLTEWYRAVIVLDPNVMPKQYAWRRISEEAIENIEQKPKAGPQPQIFNIAQSPVLIPQQAEKQSQPIIQSRKKSFAVKSVDTTVNTQNNTSPFPVRKKRSLFNKGGVFVGASLVIISIFLVVVIIFGSAWSFYNRSGKFFSRSGISTQIQDLLSIDTKQEQDVLPVSAQTALEMVPKGIRLEFTDVIFFDAFDKPGNWDVGNYSDDYSNTSQKIDNGSYIFDIDLIKKGAVQRITVPNAPLKDFYFQVDAKRIIGSTTNDCYGIAFREISNKYYVLKVCDNKHFQVRYYSGTEWTDIGTVFSSSAIKLGTPNRLGVLAKDEQFYIYINNLKVYSFKDDKLSNAGDLNLVVAPSSVSKAASFEFDNIIILEPSSQHSSSTPLPVSGVSPQTMTDMSVNAKEKWGDTGFNVSVGDRITIKQVSGSWSADFPDFDFVDANGYFTDAAVEYYCPACAAPIKDGVLGILVAQIGQSVQAVGNNRSFYSKQNGELMLMINDAYSALDDNSGSISVKITIDKRNE